MRHILNVFSVAVVHYSNTRLKRFSRRTFSTMSTWKSSVAVVDFFASDPIEASERMGVDYIGNSTIIDLEGLSLSRHMNLKAMNIFKEMILIHTYYYPESSDVVYVVNYPPVFNYFWNSECRSSSSSPVIKPWMTELQKQKLKRVPSTSSLSPPCTIGRSCSRTSSRRIFRRSTAAAASAKAAAFSAARHPTCVFSSLLTHRVLPR